MGKKDILCYHKYNIPTHISLGTTTNIRSITRICSYEHLSQQENDEGNLKEKITMMHPMMHPVQKQGNQYGEKIDKLILWETHKIMLMLGVIYPK